VKRKRRELLKSDCELRLCASGGTDEHSPARSGAGLAVDDTQSVEKVKKQKAAAEGDCVSFLVALQI
jgi:hypothetical protein